jgi:regulatory protein
MAFAARSSDEPRRPRPAWGGGGGGGSKPPRCASAAGQLAFSAPTLKSRALKMLAGREHSRTELERKLTPFEVTPGEVASTLDELAAKGFIDEQRVADSLIHRRSGKLGASRVLQELRAKGVATEIVSEAVQGLRDTEAERAQAVWDRKFGQAAAADNAQRLKQMRFLMARGFSSDAVKAVMRRAKAGGLPELHEDD